MTVGTFEPRVRSAKKFYLSAKAVGGYIDQPGIAAGYVTDLSTSRGTMLLPRRVDDGFVSRLDDGHQAGGQARCV